MIIIDDPLKPEEALSETQRRATNEWFDHTLYSRLNDNLSDAIVLIMHGLRESLPSGATPGTIASACGTSPARLRRSGSALAFGRAGRVVITERCGEP